MENLVYRLDHDKWKCLMIGSGFVYMSSKRHDTPLAFYEAIEKKGLLESQKRIPVSGITQLSLFPLEDELRFNWLNEVGKEQNLAVDFSNESDARQVAAHVAAARGIQLHERAAGKWQSMKTPLFCLASTIALTVLIYTIAVDLEAGNDFNPSGRKAWFKAVLMSVAQVLGTTGTAIVGGVISLLFAFWVYKRLKSPPVELVWR